MKIKRWHALALALAVNAAGDLPSEFRLFNKGWNETENGKYLFDDAAAEAVMSNAAAWNVDLMIDLEHQALTSDVPPDPTARDARGWFRLELRDDGSLWATNVSWTDDGAARLREKRQRYVSPAFDVDKEGRVTKIINVAITAIPATHGTPALVAARARDLRKLSTGFAFSDVQAAISAALYSRFPSDSDPCVGVWVMDVFDATAVYQLGGKLFEVAYTFDGTTATLDANAVEVQRAYQPVQAAAAPAAPTPAPAPAPAANRKTPAKTLAANGDPMANTWKQDALEAVEKGDGNKALDILKGLLAGGGSLDDADPGPPSAADGGAPAAAAAVTPAPAADDQKKKDEMAAARVILALSGKTDPAEATTEITRLVTLAKELEVRQASLDADRATLDAAERRKLVANLVTLGAELPAHAWADPLKPTVPCDRLAKEPLDSLRTRVQQLAAVRGVKLNAAPVTPPVSLQVGAGGAGGKDVQTPNGVVTLSARELDMFAEMKFTPEQIDQYAATKAGRTKA